MRFYQNRRRSLDLLDATIIAVAIVISSAQYGRAQMLPPTPEIGDEGVSTWPQEDAIFESGSNPQFWCPPELEFLGTGEHLSSRYDPARAVTEVYIGDYDNNQILRHDIDSNLAKSTTSLPLTYGIPWLATDLDRDGQFELVIQRGDPGFGGNGYLDIVQGTTWTLHKRFTFGNQKGWMHPKPVNLDSDPYSELFFTLNDGFGGPCQAAIVDYSVDSGFFLRYLIPVPFPTGWYSAVGDVDNDGVTEMITCGPEGYSLFEWKNDSLVFVGLIDSTFANNNAASIFYPKPDSIPRLLIGHATTPDYGFKYEVLRAVADNSFEIEYEIVHLFSGGRSISRTMDSDCDGLDEFVFERWPWYVEYEWDEQLQDYVEKCAWNAHDSLEGALNEWHTIDFTRDGSPEWAAIAGSDMVYAFQNPTCLQCNPQGTCPIPSPCKCDCHGDPKCDGTKSDVVDVVKAVGIAFRGESVPYDSDCRFERSDFDCSGTTNVVDVVKVIDVAFRGESPNSAFCDPCEQ